MALLTTIKKEQAPEVDPLEALQEALKALGSIPKDKDSAEYREYMPKRKNILAQIRKAVGPDPYEEGMRAQEEQLADYTSEGKPSGAIEALIESAAGKPKVWNVERGIADGASAPITQKRF